MAEYGWVRSMSKDLIEVVPVYLKGATTRPDEGEVGYDMRVRPKHLGQGPYTVVVSPQDIIEMRPYA